MKNKLIIAAGTGFLGNVLIQHFNNKFEEMVVSITDIIQFTSIS